MTFPTDITNINMITNRQIKKNIKNINVKQNKNKYKDIKSMADSLQNILKDIQIAKLVYYKSCLILLPEIRWSEHPMQQAEQVIFT